MNLRMVMIRNMIPMLMIPMMKMTGGGIQCLSNFKKSNPKKKLVKSQFHGISFYEYFSLMNLKN